MAEFCLDCFNRMNRTDYRESDVELDEDFCEGCGTWKPCVIFVKTELRTCYCPICDKHFQVRLNDSGGSCPDCGHHVVLHGVEVVE